MNNIEEIKAEIERGAKRFGLMITGLMISTIASVSGTILMMIKLVAENQQDMVKVESLLIPAILFLSLSTFNMVKASTESHMEKVLSSIRDEKLFQEVLEYLESK